MRSDYASGCTLVGLPLPRLRSAAPRGCGWEAYDPLFNGTGTNQRHKWNMDDSKI